MAQKVKKILDSTADGEGDWHVAMGRDTAYQGIVTGTGAVTATIDVYGSNDGSNAIETKLGTITLSGSDAVSDGFVDVAPWKYHKGVVSNLTGTGARVQVLVGTDE